MLDHVILTVKDLKRSLAFYRRALKPLEITEFTDYRGKDGHPDLKGFGEDGRFIFWLKAGQPDPAAVHVGFVATSQAAVKAFYRKCVFAGDFGPWLIRTPWSAASGTLAAVSNASHTPLAFA